MWAMKDIKVGGKWIGQNHRPFIIAEMSGNHNQSLERALQIIDAAADSGVDALKIQTYKAETMTLDITEGDFYINDDKSLWKGRSLYELYEEAHTPWEWHKAIFDHCKKRNVLCFSTPFDTTAVDFLEELEVPFYKIASFENTDIPLIKKVAQTGKPMIISTGMASVSELELSVKTARNNGCKDIILLKCTSTYPADPSNTNISTIKHMRELFGVQVGLSDHTMGIGVACASVAFGATVVEKHFTLSRAEGGVDSAFSLEPAELKSLVIETERAWQSLGQVTYGCAKNEEKSKAFRRSIYICDDLKAGDILTEKNLRCIRPGFGLPPKHYERLLGQKVKKEVKKGTPMKFEFI